MKNLLDEYRFTARPTRIHTSDGHHVDVRVEGIPDTADGRTAVWVSILPDGSSRWIALDHIVAVEDAPASG